MADVKSRLRGILFFIGILFKGIDGLVETIGGIFLFFVSKANVHHVLIFLARLALAKDPDNLIAHHVMRIGKHLSLNTKTFVSIYLIGHGLVKIVLVVNLLRNKMWAYPVAIVLLLGFVGYQIFRLCQHFSWTLSVFTVLDIIIVALIALEYRAKRKKDG